MNFKSVLFLLFLAPFMLLAQDDNLNRLDSNGKRHGKWEKRYDSGRIRYRGQFYHGKEVGDFYFYENKIINNLPTIKKFYIKGTDVADVIFYDIRGKLKSDGQMIGKKRIGVWRFYDNEGNVVLKEEYNNDGILHGKYIVYFRNAKVAEEKNYKNGKLDGVSTRFSERGVKLHEMTYREGLLHGRTVFYEVNGNRKESGLYYKDYKVGKWDYYIDGEYMGYKEPNKKRDRPDDAAIMASIQGKKKKERTYAKISDEQIMKNIEGKKEEVKEYRPLTDKEILRNIERKREEDEGYEPLTDDEILRSIEAKRQKFEEFELLSDREILNSIKFKKKAPKVVYSKRTDEDILRSMSAKMEARIKEAKRLGKAQTKSSIKAKKEKLKKLTNQQILNNIKRKNGTLKEVKK